jgi:hypothetical protein
MPLFFSLFWEANKSGELGILREVPEQPQEVAAGGSLSKSVLVVGDKAELWITFRNRSADTVSKLKVLRFDVPGFRIDALCWHDGTKNVCSKPENIEIPQIFKGQTVVLWGDVTATEQAEKHICYALLSWTDPAGARSEMVIPFGTNIIETLWERRLRAVRELMKDFALPLLLVFLGLYVGQWDKDREAKRQIHEAEIQQAHLTWNSMLPETYKLAIRYYMKILAALGGLLRELEKAHSAIQKTPADPQTLALTRRSFFYLMLFERRIKYFLDLNSGFYFKCRAGEDIVVNAHDRYRKLYLGDNENVRRNFLRMVEHTELTETMDTFLQKLDGTGNHSAGVKQDFKNGWADFSIWIPTRDCQAAIGELKAFELVLAFELNRPYAYWYGWEETLRYWKQTQVELKSVGDDLYKLTEERSVANLITAYLKYGEPKPLITGS